MLRPPRPATLLANLRRAWRRSLQLRVVSITLVMSTLLVGTFGLVVANRIIDGLLDAKAADAHKQVAAGTETVKEYVRQVPNPRVDPYLNTNLPGLVAGLVRGNPDGFSVAVVPTEPNIGELDPQAQPNALAFRQLPTAFRQKVASGGFYEQREMIEVDGQGAQPYLIVGRSVTARTYQLEVYYFFPLDDEVRAATLVRNILFATGTALVLLLAAVAFLVTRMVVSPVRVAARTAQRLSAGLLDQRMEVRGEDDLAALAASFNQMAENLQRHIQRLEEMSRLQRRFTSDVSHELRTPLTTVRMAADLIFTERDGFDAPVARSAELLQAELDRFERLLTDLLEISRFDAGFAVLDAEPTDLVPIVHRVVDQLRGVAERASVDFDLVIPDEPVIAEIDPRRVERVLRNLVGNAVDHGERQPVEVRLAVADGVVALTVRDHGVGLKPGEEKLVFNRFWRADPSRARQTGGSGLGLSISVEDARLHGGWLEAWGAPGKGAQFRLTLPTRAGEHLTSSPLRLVPEDVDARPVVGHQRDDAVAEPGADLLVAGPAHPGETR
ncbi:two-component system sensor histidine kinase MtrB [Luedemannella flava]|uniref:Sensor histidine kinase MtrB n=1 Tax=Luedemannella flava TaxID=349316 RepID=A0ABP4YMQ4_9ACTN